MTTPERATRQHFRENQGLDRRIPHSTSAQDRLKARYARTLTVSILVSLGIALLALRFSPALEISPYRLAAAGEREAASPFVRLLPPSVEIVDDLLSSQGPAEEFAIEESLPFAPTRLHADFDPGRPKRPALATTPIDFALLPPTRSTALFRMNPVEEIPEEMDLRDVVVVKVRVGDEGNVVEAYVHKGINQVLDEQALIAAWQIELPARSREAASNWLSLPYEFQRR